MKQWTIWALPAALFLIIFSMLVFSAGSATWPESPSFLNMPYFLLIIAILLGVAFSQSRVTFVSLLLLSVVFAANRALSVDPQGRGPAVVLLATIYVPLLVVIFRHLREVSVFTAKGAGRSVLILSSAIMILLLPEVEFFRKGISESGSVLINPLPGALRIPGIGLLTFGIAIPLLLLKREHENIRTGPAMAFSLLFVIAGLNFRSALWTVQEAQSVLLAFESGAALVLIWHVLENLWFDAYRDELTELPGRRSMKQHLAQLEQSYSIAILDIDHFKLINDKYGHDTGDQVLRFIATHLRDIPIGKSYRYGGEEFVIVSERDSYDDTVAGLDELRRRIADRQFMLRAGRRPRRKPVRHENPHEAAPAESIEITVSIGVARWSDKHATTQEVFGAADKALYSAKNEGRNCLRNAS